jgi:TolB-like protein/Flp pilus assembly protein TadD
LSLFAELKRRKVFKAGAAYLVVAWLAVQVVSIAFPAFEAPPWVLRVFILMAMLGFPVALMMAWAFEATPDGLRRDTAAVGTKRMAAIVVALAALALGWYFLGAPAIRADAPPKAVAAAASPPAPVPAPQAAAAPRLSIAVLPFVNMSADADNEYFSDGISEEILNALAKVDGLKVAGRTSSFHFKGKQASLQEIGTALGVAHVLEGSVRKQGDKVRITAQLIQVGDGYHLWSETYDGDLADVFELQERIARAITDGLKVVLQGAQAERLVDAGTSNPEAYQLYLQASSIFNRRDRTRFLDAIAALQRAVQLDPTYARAFARLASMYVVLASYTDTDLRQAHEQSMRHASEALALEPRTAEAWAARGASLSKFRESQVEGREAFEESMRIDPDDPNSSFWNGLNLLVTGYRRLGTAQIEHTLALEPMLPNALRWRGLLYLQDGDVARAEPLLQRAYDLGLANTANALSDIAMLRGDAAASARLWIDGSMGLDFNMSRDELAAVHRGLHGDDTARQEGVRVMQEVLARTGKKKALPTAPLYLFRLGAFAEGLAVLREREMGERIDSMIWIWTRAGAPIRALPEFPAFLREYHLPELWDKYGPPDLCRKDAQGDYHCE